MKAMQQSDRMVAWFEWVGVGRYDLAVRRGDGTFISEHSRGLDRAALARCLPWVRFENVHGADIYIRPARGASWPVVFLDDVAAARARAVAGHYASLVVRTSSMSEGGCHLWLRVGNALDEAARKQVQRWLAARLGADAASTSGEHWGRLAGTKNHKRGGCWVGVIASSQGPACDERRIYTALAQKRSAAALPASPPATPSCAAGAGDRDESIAEFAWCCHHLRQGRDPEAIAAALTRRARARGKRSPERYARRTLQAAKDHLWPPDGAARR